LLRPKRANYQKEKIKKAAEAADCACVAMTTLLSVTI